MDLSRLGGSGWSSNPLKRDANLPSFQLGEPELASVHHVSDLLAVTRSRDARSFLGERKNFATSSSMPSLHANTTQTTQSVEGDIAGITNTMSASGGLKKVKRRVPANPLRQPPPTLSYTINERPPNRVEISKLEQELEERVKYILYADESNKLAVETGDLYQPYKDQITVIRMKVLEDLGISELTLEEKLSETKVETPEDKEPWLHRRIQCEALNDSCEYISMKLIDMVSVNAAQLGNVMRKLRYTYKQSFEQMSLSWHVIRQNYCEAQQEIQELKAQLAAAQESLQIRDEKVREQVEREVQAISNQFEEEKKRDKEILGHTEAKMDQMSETLTSLNGIFKTMQQESGNHRLMDILAKCQRLEKENAELENDSLQVGKLKESDKLSKAKISSMTREMKLKEDEISYLRMELSRRDEVVASLLEKEALRDAEIDKLQQLITLKDKEKDNMQLQDSATSVLCIKCKKSLDDMSNIRAAAMGKGDSGALQRCQCEAFRILLPNLKKQPHRSVPWLRTMMRSIFISKIREDVNLMGIRGETCRFPHFAYSWFERDTEGLQGSALTKTFVMNDEDRWGLYYGVKSMARENDPEAMIFWTLLDEKFQEDGMQFISHCMSVIFSMGGSDFWNQFGDIPYNCSSINMRAGKDGKDGSENTVRRFIWLDLVTAKEATKAILNRALSSHIHDCLETIDAFLVVPEIIIEKEVEEDAEEEKVEQDPAIATSKKPLASHINLYMWLRLMLQQMHAEQIQRGAAIRLMFDTASIGALTSPLNFGNMGTTTVGSNVGSIDGSQGHVEFPQFNAICKTLFSTMSSTEVAAFYTQCYEEGKQKVNSNVFQKVADKNCLFSRFMKLSSLPLFEQHTPKPPLPPPEETDPPSESSAPASPDKTLNQKFIEASCKGKINDEQQLRVLLGSLIHRKLAALSPELQRLMKVLPERWRSLLQESLDNVNFALNDSYAKMRKRLGEKVKNVVQQHYIDGIQPFVHYRRLLSVALLVKGFSDNPIIPSEILANKNRDFSVNLDIGLQQVEKILTSLEEGIVVGNHSKYDSKYYRYDFVRKALVIRKLQNVTRNFCNSIVAVPRSVRACMRRGYLFGETNVRNRTVVFDPWFVQSLVADIYAYKIQYDLKAMMSRLPLISLPQAIVSYLYSRFSCVDMIERMTHDLLYCAKQFSNIPRLRMFCLFLGIMDEELDETIRDLYKSPHTLGVYLDFIGCVHKGLRIQSKAPGAFAAAAGETSSSASASVSITNLSEQPPLAVSTVDAPAEEDNGVFSKKNVELEKAFNGPYDPSVLFPCSKNPFDRSDKRDVWLIDSDVAQSVIQSWAQYQKGIESCPNLYTDLSQKLKPANADKQIDVDELSWILILQWSKVVIYYTKRCEARAQWSDRQSPAALYPDKTNNGGLPVTPLPADFMDNLLESVYRPGEGKNTKDPQFCQTLYTTKALKRRFLHIPVDKTPSTTLDFLKECVLWDLSNSNNTEDKMDSIFYTLKTGSNFALQFTMAKTIFDRYAEVFSRFMEDTITLCLSPKVDGAKAAEADLDKPLSEIRSLLEQIATLLAATSAPSLESNDAIWAMLNKLICSIETVRIIAKKHNKVFPFPEDAWTSVVNMRRPAILSKIPKSPSYSVATKANIV